MECKNCNKDIPLPNIVMVGSVLPELCYDCYKNV